MKETEQKTGGMPLWVMIVLVAIMVGAVIMIFQFLKMTLPAAAKPGVDITLQLSQNRVISGRMTLMQQDELPDGVAQTWAAGCESGSGYHWLTENTDTGWRMYLWLPQKEDSLTESQLEVGTAVVGDQWTFTLSLPGEAGGETGADSAILQIVSSQGKAPNRVQVYGGGQRLDCGSVSVSTGGQLFRAG